MSISRRKFVLGAATAGLAMAAGSTAYGYAVERQWVEVTRRTITIPGWPPAFEGLRVAHLTDLHHSRLVPFDYLESCVAKVNAEFPDVVALTGDYITGQEKFIDPLAEVTAKLAAPLGVFATLGNHDVWVDRLAVRRALARNGFTVLSNQSSLITRPDGRLPVVGLGDLWTERVRLAQAFRGIPDGQASLILMHNPDTFEYWPSGCGGLILAGHTHGGQVAIPGFGPPYIPSRYGRKYAKGLFQKARITMYVNRGVGTVLPVRLFVRPEIAFLTIRSA